MKLLAMKVCVLRKSVKPDITESIAPTSVSEPLPSVAMAVELAA